eukprot:66895-Rhodomonas_salina.1
MCLRACDAVSGTDIPYARPAVLNSGWGRTAIKVGPPTRCPALLLLSPVAFMGTYLRACYAMSGTDIGYAAIRLVGRKGTVPARCYAFDMQCPGTACPVVPTQCLAGRAKGGESGFLLLVGAYGIVVLVVHIS